jgi:hypothetical protein
VATANERKELRRADLKRWIAGSLRLQRRLWIALPIGGVATVACAVLLPIGVPFALILAASFYGVGRYITAAHIADWRLELENLDQPLAPISGRERDG